MFLYFFLIDEFRLMNCNFEIKISIFFLQILEKQVLTVAKAMEEKIDEEIAALDRLENDDIEVLREKRLQQMKKMAEKRKHWISLGHGEYSEIPSEKEFFSIVKASDRVVCHFYRENWPCKVSIFSSFFNEFSLLEICSVSFNFVENVCSWNLNSVDQ